MGTTPIINIRWFIFLMQLFYCLCLGEEGFLITSRAMPTRSIQLDASGWAKISTEKYLTFELVQGLFSPDKAVYSFRLSGSTNIYLRHVGYRIKGQISDGSTQFRQDSTFIRRSPLDGGDGESFESINFPGFYLHRRNFLLYITALSRTVAYHKDATWKRIYTPPVTNALVSYPYIIKSDNFPGHSIQLDRTGHLVIAPGTSAKFEMVEGLYAPGKDIYSLRLVGTEDVYLRHWGWRMKAQTFEGSLKFRLDATYVRRRPLDGGKGISFEAINWPNYYIRHRNKLLYIQKVDRSALFNRDASWTPERTTFPPPATSSQLFLMTSKNLPTYSIRFDRTGYGLIGTDLEVLFELAPALYAPGPNRYSIRIAGTTNVYLRHIGWRIRAMTFDDKVQFRLDATFIRRAPQAGDTGDSFESHNYPTYFIRHRNKILYITRRDNTVFPLDSTWIRTIKPRPSQTGASVPYLFKPSNFPTHSMQLASNGYGIIAKGHYAKFQLMKPLFASNTELYNFRLFGATDVYLRHVGFRMRAQKSDGSMQFLLDSGFVRRKPLAGGVGDSFESINYPGYYIRHRSLLLYLHKIDKSPVFNLDATWTRTPIATLPVQQASAPFLFVSRTFRTYSFQLDLGGYGVVSNRPNAKFELVSPLLSAGQDMYSFRLAGTTDIYLRHVGLRMRAQKFDGTVQFRLDSTYMRRKPLSGGEGDSYESINHPEHYIRHYSNKLIYIRKFDRSATFNTDATWIRKPSALVPAVPPQKSYLIKSRDFPTYQIQIDRTFYAIISKTSYAKFEIVRGLHAPAKDVISFRLVGTRDIFLRHWGWRVRAHKFDDSLRFRQDATYKRKPPLDGGSGVSYESMNYPDHYMRHSNFLIYISKRSNTVVFNKGATWGLSEFDNPFIFREPIPLPGMGQCTWACKLQGRAYQYCRRCCINGSCALTSICSGAKSAGSCPNETPAEQQPVCQWN